MRSAPPLVVLVLGGVAERWDCPEQDSPLASAATPHLDRMAVEGRVFGVELTDDPCSAAPMLAILGYDPEGRETARASYLGAQTGRELALEECFVSADFVALFRDTVADVEPGPLRHAETSVLARAAGTALRRAGYRLLVCDDTHHVAVAPRASVDEELPSSEQILGRSLEELVPRVEQHAFALRLGREALDGHEVNEVRRDLGENGADMLWLWGPGGSALLEPIYDAESDPVSAFGSDPLWRAVCDAAKIPIKAPSARKPAGVLRGVAHALAEDRVCFVFSRRGTADALQRQPRAEGIAELDHQLVGPLGGLVARRGGRILILSDVARDSANGAPLAGPVPALLWGAGIEALSHHSFTEAGAAAAGEPLSPGHGLVAYVRRF